MGRTKKTSKWCESLKNGDRRALSKAITLAESSKYEDRLLLTEILKQRDPKSNSFRLAVSGAPGVGKSTFIDNIGSLFASSFRVAVLSIDPSSPKSGGSILGDKTRMEKLSPLPNVYIRPSPGRKGTGGVHMSTADAIALCEMAGYDIIIVETIGVGQSETLVDQITDHFLLVMNPGGGDDLQGIKRGIMELADTFVFNKIDISPENVLKKSESDLKIALHLLRPNDKPRIYKVSSLGGTGLNDVYEYLKERKESEHKSGLIQSRREKQKLNRFEFIVELELLSMLKENEVIANSFVALKDKISNRDISVNEALERFRKVIKK